MEKSGNFEVEDNWKYIISLFNFSDSLIVAVVPGAVAATIIIMMIKIIYWDRI